MARPGRSKAKAMSTMSNRYEICDPVCGLVVTERKKYRAFKIALAHAKTCKGVVVFDLLAHSHTTHLWGVNWSTNQVLPLASKI